MKNILIVTDTLDINDSSGAKANLAIIENLVALGYNVHAIHNTIGEFTASGYTEQKINIRKWSILYVFATIVRLFYRYTRFDLNKWLEPILGFSFEFFSTCAAYYRTINEQHKSYDFILTLSKGASFRPHYAMLKCSKLHHKWLAYIHDPYPMHYYPRPYNWVQPGYKQKEEFFARLSQHAKWIAFPSQLLLDWMSSYFPKMEQKSLVIPHQISSKHPIHFDTEIYWNDNDFNLLHAGNIMKQRPADGLIEGFKLFLTAHPEAKSHARLHLIGPADFHKKQLSEVAAQTPEINLNLNGIPYHQAYWLQQHAAVNIILESKSEISPFLPGKFPHCIMAGKPILLLCPYYAESRRLLGDDYPYRCENNNSTAIAHAIETLYLAWKAQIPFHLPQQQELLKYMGPQYLQDCLNKLED